MAGFVFLVACNCDSSTLGSDGEPQCVVCTHSEPYWRACTNVTVASGGQPVCDEGSGVVLCVSKRAYLCRDKQTLDSALNDDVVVTAARYAVPLGVEAKKSR